MDQSRLQKQLQSQLQIAIQEREALKAQIEQKQKESSNKLKFITGLKRKIDSLNIDTTPRVSEHAVLRYLERCHGLNISDVERQILTDEVLVLIEKLGGNGTYPADGFSVKMKDYTVTTVLI